jgi:predicted DNA-binding transcriptional regulator AlpA
MRNAAVTAPVEADPLLDVPAVAKYYGVSEFTVWRMIERDEIPAFNLGGKAGRFVRIRLSSLQRQMGRWEVRGVR